MQSLTAGKIRVLVADDHDLYRDGLRLLLKSENQIDMIGEASNGLQLIQLAEAMHPDVILIDLIMPVTDGIMAITHLSKSTSCRMIALSTFNNDHLILGAINAGATGYLLKNADRSDILKAIIDVYKNKPFYCSGTSTKLAKLILQERNNHGKKQKMELLSPREKQIIRLICEQKSNAEIGKELFIGIRTVEGIRAKIIHKINAKTPAGIVTYAIKNALYYLPPDESGELSNNHMLFSH